jgi:hypothetical protein
VRVSAEYGRLLFSLIYQGWRVMAAGYQGDIIGHYDVANITDAATAYEQLWAAYRRLGDHPECATLFEARYFNLPGSTGVAGLDETVAHYREQVVRVHARPLKSLGLNDTTLKAARI